MEFSGVSSVRVRPLLARAGLIIIQIIFLCSPNAFAVSCPMDHQDYQRALTDFRNFEEVVEKVNSKGESCHSVMEVLTDLSSFYGKNTRNIIYKAGIFKSDEVLEANLTIEELQRLNSYTEDMATKIARVVSLMGTKPSCFAEEKRPSFLGGMAALIGEVTTMVSAYSGPSGIPLAMGAQLFSGVLFGLDRVMTEWDIYDVRKEDHRALYAKHLCAYDGIRKQVEILLRPQEVLAQLTLLESKSSASGSTLRKDCEICGTYEKSLRIISKVDSNRSTLSYLAGDNSITEQEKCLELVDQVSFSGEIDRVLTEINEHHSDQNNGLDRALQLMELVRGRKKVVDLDACINTPSKLLKEANLATVGYGRKALAWAIELTRSQVTKAQKNKKGTVAMWLTAQAELNWARSEKKKYQQYVNGSEFAKAELGRERECMDERLFEFTAPEFIDYYIERSTSRHKLFQKELKSTVDPLHRKVKGKNFSFGFKSSAEKEDRRADLIPELLESVRDDAKVNSYKIDQVALATDMGHIEDLMEQVGNDLALVERYCAYFRSNSHAWGKLRNICDASKLQKIRETALRSQSVIHEACRTHETWCNEQGILDSNPTTGKVIKKIKQY